MSVTADPENQVPAPESVAPANDQGSPGEGGAGVFPPDSTVPVSPPSKSQGSPGSPASQTPDGGGVPQPEDKGNDEEIQGIKAQLKDQAKQLKAARGAMRDTLLDQLGVLPAYREYAPDADPFTPEGRKAYEDWATKRPEILSRRIEAPKPQLPDRDKLKSTALIDFDRWAQARTRRGK